MIQVRYDFMYEDRFNIAYRHWLSRLLPHERIIIERSIQVIDKETFIDAPDCRYISFTVNLRHKFLLKFLNFIDDTENIMGIPMQFRYVGTTENAYDAGAGVFLIKWCNFV